MGAPGLYRLCWLTTWKKMFQNLSVSELHNQQFSELLCIFLRVATLNELLEYECQKAVFKFVPRKQMFLPKTSVI